ncbi:MAG: hypothetical protein MK135_08715, partial [Polyangiaceae bacterium]|nr:hypothetical protein [Polyangiaceae bacterium]
MRGIGFFLRLVLSFSVLFAPLYPDLAQAAPEAHILRIDPRTSLLDGNPVLSVVFDLSAHRPLERQIASCGRLRGNQRFDCITTATLQGGAQGKPIPFPEEQVQLGIRLKDKERPAKYLDHFLLGSAFEQPRVGTAWLLVLDTDSRMGKSLPAARAVVERFIDAMAPNDQVKLVILGERDLINETPWLQVADKAKASLLLNEAKANTKSKGRNRPLASMIEALARHAVIELNDSQAPILPPLHQAMVVLSNGYGGGDPLVSRAGGEKIAKALTRGQLDEDNDALPRLPLPVISIFVPPTIQSATALLFSRKADLDEISLAQEFMMGLATPRIGGFFTVLRPAQEDLPRRIVEHAHQRFAKTIIARFSLSCLAPRPTQDLSLLFPGAAPAIAGDSSFKNVPLGIAPQKWPLLVDEGLTRQAAARNENLSPGGELKVFGEFCWDNDRSRPAAYFIPAGETFSFEEQTKLDDAKELQKRLVALDMRGAALEAGQTFVQLAIPDTPQVLNGEGKNTVVRFIVVDEETGRTTGLTAQNILQLPGHQKKTPRLYYFIGAALGSLLLFLIILGLKLNRRANQAPMNQPRNTITETPYAEPAPLS